MLKITCSHLGKNNLLSMKMFTVNFLLATILLLFSTLSSLSEFCSAIFCTFCFLLLQINKVLLRKLNSLYIYITYIGSTGLIFKDRFTKNKYSFRHEKHSNNTTLSQFILKLKTTILISKLIGKF